MVLIGKHDLPYDFQHYEHTEPGPSHKMECSSHLLVLSQKDLQAGRLKVIPDMRNNMATDSVQSMSGRLTIDCIDPEPLRGLEASSRGEKGPGESSPVETGLAG